MSDEKDVTVREGTIITLDGSRAGFHSLKESFKSISDAFDRGDSVNGLNMIAENIIGPTNAMFGFFMTVAGSYDVILGEELTRNLISKIKAIDELIDILEKETGAGNLVEVGDVLRFDYFDALTELEGLIPQFVEKFKNSTAPELDQH